MLELARVCRWLSCQWSKKPYRHNGKLVMPLCRSGVEKEMGKPLHEKSHHCTHSPEQRLLQKKSHRDGVHHRYHPRSVALSKKPTQDRSFRQLRQQMTEDQIRVGGPPWLGSDRRPKTAVHKAVQWARGHQVGTHNDPQKPRKESYR